MRNTARLVVFAGLPGAGKTTIAKRVATESGAAYLRIDVIEQAIGRAGRIEGGVGPLGYIIAQDLALANLILGNSVVADAMNAVAESRNAWRVVARQARVDIIEVEVLCSDIELHRRRVTERTPDITGHQLPDWAKISSIRMEPWNSSPLVLDTAKLSVEDAVKCVCDAVQ